MDVFIGRHGFKFHTLRAMQPWKMAEMMSNTFVLSRYRRGMLPLSYSPFEKRYGTINMGVVNSASNKSYDDFLSHVCASCDKEYKFGDHFTEIGHYNVKLSDESPYTYYELYKLMTAIYGKPKHWKNLQTVVQIWNLDITKFEAGLVPYFSGIVGIKDLLIGWFKQFRVYRSESFTDEGTEHLWDKHFAAPIMYQIQYGENLFFMFGDADPNSEMCTYICTDSMFDARKG